MGFRHWFQGLEMVGLFLFVVGVPCFFIAVWGSKMINDIGNHPSQNAQIQAAIGLKILIVELVSFALLIGLYAFLFNLQNG